MKTSNVLLAFGLRWSTDHLVARHSRCPGPRWRLSRKWRALSCRWRAPAVESCEPAAHGGGTRWAAGGGRYYRGGGVITGVDMGTGRGRCCGGRGARSCRRIRIFLRILLPDSIGLERLGTYVNQTVRVC